MHAKLKKRGETSPALPDTPSSAGSRAKVLPQWMYRDPAEVVERVETAELRAEARSRIRELVREQELERMQQSTLEQMAAALRRVIFAPPDIRIKRARIQALVRAERLKEQK